MFNDAWTCGPNADLPLFSRANALSKRPLSLPSSPCSAVPAKEESSAPGASGSDQKEAGGGEESLAPVGAADDRGCVFDLGSALRNDAATLSLSNEEKIASAHLLSILSSAIALPKYSQSPRRLALTHSNLIATCASSVLSMSPAALVVYASDRLMCFPGADSHARLGTLLSSCADAPLLAGLEDLAARTDPEKLLDAARTLLDLTTQEKGTASVLAVRTLLQTVFGVNPDDRFGPLRLGRIDGEIKTQMAADGNRKKHADGSLAVFHAPPPAFSSGARNVDCPCIDQASALLLSRGLRLECSPAIAPLVAGRWKNVKTPSRVFELIPDASGSALGMSCRGGSVPPCGTYVPAGNQSSLHMKAIDITPFPVGLNITAKMPTRTLGGNDESTSNAFDSESAREGVDGFRLLPALFLRPRSPTSRGVAKGSPSKIEPLSAAVGTVQKASIPDPDKAFVLSDVVELIPGGVTRPFEEGVASDDQSSLIALGLFLGITAAAARACAFLMRADADGNRRLLAVAAAADAASSAAAGLGGRSLDGMRMMSVLPASASAVGYAGLDDALQQARRARAFFPRPDTDEEVLLSRLSSRYAADHTAATAALFGSGPPSEEQAFLVHAALCSNLSSGIFRALPDPDFRP